MYTLTVKETGNKSSKFHYQVINDTTGEVVSERKSNRVYVACTIHGEFYFGRIDLIGKGDHGWAIKKANGWGYDEKRVFRSGVKEPNPETIKYWNTIAYKK